MAISSPNVVQSREPSGIEALQRGMAQLQEYGQWRGTLKEQMRQADLNFAQNFMNMYQANPDAMILFARQNKDLMGNMLSTVSSVDPEAAAGFVESLGANHLTPHGEEMVALGHYIRGTVAEKGGLPENEAMDIVNFSFQETTPEATPETTPGGTTPQAKPADIAPTQTTPTTPTTPGGTPPVTAPGPEPWMSAQPQGGQQVPASMQGVPLADIPEARRRELELQDPAPPVGQQPIDPRAMGTRGAGHAAQGRQDRGQQVYTTDQPLAETNATNRYLEIGRDYAAREAAAEMERNAARTGQAPQTSERLTAPGTVAPPGEVEFRAKLREAIGRPVDGLTTEELEIIQANGGDTEAAEEFLRRKEETGNGAPPVGEAMLNETKTFTMDAPPITPANTLDEQAEAGVGRMNPARAKGFQRQLESIEKAQQRFNVEVYGDREQGDIPQSEIKRIERNMSHLRDTTGEYANVLGPENNGQREERLAAHSAYYGGVLNRLGGIDNVMGRYFDNPRERALLELETRILSEDLDRQLQREENAFSREVQREYHDVLRAQTALSRAEFNWKKGLVEGAPPPGEDAGIDPSTVNSFRQVLEDSREAFYNFANTRLGEGWNEQDLAKLLSEDPTAEQMYTNYLESNRNLYIAMGIMPGPQEYTEVRLSGLFRGLRGKDRHYRLPLPPQMGGGEAPMDAASYAAQDQALDVMIQETLNALQGGGNAGP